MKRPIVLVMAALLMAAMLVTSTGVAQALGSGGTVSTVRTPSGVAVDPTACELLAEGSGMFAWRADGEVCWFTPPVK